MTGDIKPDVIRFGIKNEDRNNMIERFNLSPVILPARFYIDDYDVLSTQMKKGVNAVISIKEGDNKIFCIPSKFFLDSDENEFVEILKFSNIQDFMDFRITNWEDTMSQREILELIEQFKLTQIRGPCGHEYKKGFIEALEAVLHLSDKRCFIKGLKIESD